MELIETIGALAFVYALLSVLASSLKEVIEVRLQQRKAGLKSAIEDLLTVQGAAALVGHASIDVINQASAVTDPSKHTNWPSYLDPNTFAQAVCTLERLEQLPPDSRLAQALAALKLPGSDNERLQAIASIYSQRMDRLQGTFKRHAQYWLIGIGFLLAAAFNADTIELARDLSENPARRELVMALAQQQQACVAPHQTAASAALSEVQQSFECLKPILGQSGLGWREAQVKRLCDLSLSWASLVTVLWKLLGYGLTALAVSLGAPFWFDLLGKVANLRATLKPPAAPSAPTGA